MKSKIINVLCVSLVSFSSVSFAEIPESRMINYEKKVSISKEKEVALNKLGEDVYKSSVDKLYSQKNWGKYGAFTKVGMEVQGSLAYGMALNDSSDLDIAFIYQYNGGASMSVLDPVALKHDAVNAFKDVFGNRFKYAVKDPVVNLSNATEDVDIAFFNILKSSKSECSTTNRCSELNYGKDSSSAGWYLSERLSLYGKFDDLFTKNTTKRNVINRAGKLFKLWRGNVFSKEEVKIPSIALVTMMYDFSKDKGSAYSFNKSTDLLRDVTSYGITRYFKSDKCEGASSAEIDLPVYQKDRNLLSKLSSAQRIKTCEAIVAFNKALRTATSPIVSESDSVKALEPYLGKF
ncbi:hypothetical protein [Serratia liquefaciens]|uniref:hypothetical protein n=1 Tax=Serratia liquefaciens TaxID=614 RepID=UPI00301D3AD9